MVSFFLWAFEERLSSIKRAHVVVINGKKNDSFEKKINNISNNIEIFYSNYEPINIKEFQNERILAFAGIGNPDNFFKLLRENNIDLQKIAFPDHYELRKSEIKILSKKLQKKLVIHNRKRFYRLKKYDFKEIRYIKIRLKITDEKNFRKINNSLC